MVIVYREGDDKAGTWTLESPVEQHVSAQSVDECATEGQSETETFLEGIEFDEALEDMLCLIVGDAGTSVFYCDEQLITEDGIKAKGLSFNLVATRPSRNA